MSPEMCVGKVTQICKFERSARRNAVCEQICAADQNIRDVSRFGWWINAIACVWHLRLISHSDRRLRNAAKHVAADT